MISSDDLISPTEYQRVLRPLLPKQAFKPAPYKLAILAAHLLVIFGGYLAIGHTAHWLSHLGASLVIGHSIACLAFLAHELSHNTITSNRRLRYGLELVFWALNFIPPTVWRRVHNHTHHLHTNTPRDPDRQFLKSENSFLARWYTRLFMPCHRHPRWNPLVALHFVPYILRQIAGAFCPNEVKLPVSPAQPPYKLRQRVAVLGELAWIVLLQTAVFHLVGGTWAEFFFASPLALLITSGVVMAYVFTNHFLNPICESSDPLASSTSVIVPRWVDRLHSNFSYHTEHHLFPGMNSDYYPAVSNLLQEHFGERYHCIPFGDAWKRLWNNDLLIWEAADMAKGESGEQPRFLATPKPPAKVLGTCAQRVQ